MGGALAVVTCAYLAAVFLTAEARSRGLTELEGWFRRRALASAAVAGTVAIVGVVILRADSPRLFHHLLGPAVPFLASSAAAGLAALVVLDRDATRAPRLFATAAVSAVVVGWGVAQYPYLLGTHLSISEAAAPVDHSSCSLGHLRHRRARVRPRTRLPLRVAAAVASR